MALQSRLYSLVARRLGGSSVGTTEPPSHPNEYIEKICPVFCSQLLTFIYYGYIKQVYFSISLCAICKFFASYACRTCFCDRAFLVCKFFEELETNFLTRKISLFSRHRDPQALFFLT